MAEYRIAAKEDMELLLGSRLEMLRVVNDLPDDYEFAPDMVRESREYFATGDQTTILALEQGQVLAAQPCAISA